jgi:hypothetical protein
MRVREKKTEEELKKKDSPTFFFYACLQANNSSSDRCVHQIESDLDFASGAVPGPIALKQVTFSVRKVVAGFLFGYRSVLRHCEAKR